MLEIRKIDGAHHEDKRNPITPYKTSLYIVLISVEKQIQVQESTNAMKNERRSYVSLCLWTLINMPFVSLPSLKCYVYKFLNSDGLFKSFILTLQNYEKREMVPNAESLLFTQNTISNFVRPLSLLGFFVRTYDAEYSLMTTNELFKQRRLWCEYLKQSATDEELDRLSTQWRFDLREVLQQVDKAENEIRQESRLRVPLKPKHHDPLIEFF
ncbi:hypothetical protein M3Y98_00804000 [Aphelenchoides besseyi]|nr:hypothetical protein M3Y98_00804000 [Aphelenchoides besseyi]KAI6212065.1 hypothetical protein M3Y96_00500800 [Aphelenchoides besseyi]